MKHKISLMILLLMFIIMLLMIKDRFISTEPTFNLTFLYSNTPTKMQKNIFPTNFVAFGNCQYPEQCPNPQTHLWGGTSATATA